MANRGARRRFSSVALALLASLIVLGIAAPIIISVGVDHISVGSSRLIAAPRDSVVVSAPVSIGTSRLLTIERGLLYPADSRGRALDTPLSNAQLASGNNRFLIENATLKLQAGQADAISDHASPLIDALAAMQFETLLLRKATVHLQLPDGRIETMSDIDGEIVNRRKTTLLINGSGYVRGQRVKFEVASGLPGDAKPGGSVPLKLTLKSALLETAFDGRLSFSAPAQMHGAVEFTIPQIRQVARWFGAPWPAGDELRNLSGRGQLEWSGATMAFHRAAFELDGNEATGSLHLNFTTERPSIGGTLALKALDLGRYFPRRVPLAKPAATGTWTALMNTDLTLPLTQFVDADLRISSDKVQLGSVQLGRAAAAVTVAHGKMLADVGAFEFDGGRGNGQFSADMSGSSPKVTVRGRLDDVDSARMTTGLFGHPVVAGKATITCDVVLTGRTGDDLLASSHGKINVDIRNGGKIGIDVRGLATASVQHVLDGWGSAGRGQTTFDTLDAAFALRAGVLTAETVKATLGDVSTGLGGQVDVPTNRVNINLTQAPATPVEVKSGSKPPVVSLQIFGPWSAPTVRNDSGRDRSADPTLNEFGPPARL